MLGAANFVNITTTITPTTASFIDFLLLLQTLLGSSEHRGKTEDAGREVELAVEDQHSNDRINYNRSSCLSLLLVLREPSKGATDCGGL